MKVVPVTLVAAFLVLVSGIRQIGDAAAGDAAAAAAAGAGAGAVASSAITDFDWVGDSGVYGQYGVDPSNMLRMPTTATIAGFPGRIMINGEIRNSGPGDAGDEADDKFPFDASDSTVISVINGATDSKGVQIPDIMAGGDETTANIWSQIQNGITRSELRHIFSEAIANGQQKSITDGILGKVFPTIIQGKQWVQYFVRKQAARKKEARAEQQMLKDKAKGRLANKKYEAKAKASKNHIAKKLQRSETKSRAKRHTNELHVKKLKEQSTKAQYDRRFKQHTAKMKKLESKDKRMQEEYNKKTLAGIQSNAAASAKAARQVEDTWRNAKKQELDAANIRKKKSTRGTKTRNPDVVRLYRAKAEGN